MMSFFFQRFYNRSKRGVFITLLLLLGALQLSAQSVQWTEFADLPDSLRKSSRPLLVFIHTDWCKYCALQDHNTFEDDQISKWINEKFYAVRLNAESKEDISFLNRTYRGASTGYHELAELLAKSDGQLILPSTIILSKTFQLQQRWTGFVSVELLASYFTSITK